MQDKTQAEIEREQAMTTGVNQDLAGQRLLPAVVESVLGNLKAQAFHNFTGTQLQVWQKVAKATGPDTMPADKKIGQEIKLTNFYCHTVMIAGPTAGEYIDAIRVVLFDADGEAYSYASDGVARDLSAIIGAFGMGPYNPPISITVKQFNTRLGRRAYSIQPFQV